MTQKVAGVSFGGVILPLAEAWVAVTALLGCVQKRALDQGWVGDGGDGEDKNNNKSKYAGISDAWRFLKMDWHLMLLALSGLTVRKEDDEVA
jgi:hypothetical protein